MARTETSWEFAGGPLPEPSYVIVTSWKWVQRGLDPKLKYPSSMYKALLEGRVTTSGEDGERPRNILKVWDKNRISNITERLETLKDTEAFQNITTTKKKIKAQKICNLQGMKESCYECCSYRRRRLRM